MAGRLLSSSVTLAVLATAATPIRRAAAMKQYVGLDVSQKSTNVCIVDEEGRQLWTGKCLSTPEAIATVVRERAPLAERVGLETGPLCVCITMGSRRVKIPVLCIDARHAKAALSMQLNKTDENDAAGLAQIMPYRLVREVHVKSFNAHLQRSMLQSRLQLVNMRRDASNQVRGALKVFGIVLPPGDWSTFRSPCARTPGRARGPKRFIEPLLAAWRAFGEQVALLDKRLRKAANEHCGGEEPDDGARVGPLIGMAYVATIDDPSASRNPATWALI